MVAGDLERLIAVGRREHRIAADVERQPGQQPDALVILHQQDRFPVGRILRSVSLHRSHPSCCGAGRVRTMPAGAG